MKTQLSTTDLKWHRLLPVFASLINCRKGFFCALALVRKTLLTNTIIIPVRTFLAFHGLQAGRNCSRHLHKNQVCNIALKSVVWAPKLLLKHAKTRGIPGRISTYIQIISIQQLYSNLEVFTCGKTESSPLQHKTYH